MTGAKTDMYKITVPATSANVGAGFDTSGIAVSLYNTVYFAASDRVDIRSLDEVKIPIGTDNLVFRAAEMLFVRAGKKLSGLCLRQINNIPLTRGLGSSSACIVAGLLGANAMLNNMYSNGELADIAALLEGHPDNVMPAFLGGFSTSVIQDDGTVLYTHFDIEQSLDFYVFVPPFELSTEVARSVLPKTVLYSDAVFNLSRSGLLTASFASKDYRLLKEAVRDRIHQPFRLSMIEGGNEIFELAYSFGALAAYVSGAGSSLMAIVSMDNVSFVNRIEDALKQNKITAQYKIFRLKADNRGATIKPVSGIPI